MVVISSKQPLQAEGTARRSSGSNNKRRTSVSASAGALVVSAVGGVGCTGKQRREHGIMSVFTNSDLLEEIVETTEEQEGDLCSGGETVDECSGLPIGDYIEEPEQKHQPHLHQQVTQQAQPSGRSQSSSSSSSSKQKGSRSSGSQQGNVSLSNGTSTSRGTTRYPMEQEKRMRREIANSNERRRMQSINAGFQSLRTLLPHHEGEKLSKAAILQQTAEYIYQLEQQKTQLLSQNLQLKRLVDQHEGGDVPTKKRKCDNQGVVVSLPVHVSESGDEGLGSMSPEPLSVITVSADGHASVASNEVAELKRQLERERLARAHLEKEIRTIQNQQIYPERFREEQIMTYQPHEVIEHTNNVLPPILEDSMPEELQVVSVVSVPTVGSTQTVETSNADSNTPPLSPQPGCEVIVPSNGGDSIKEVNVSELLQIESRPSSPKIVGFTGVPVFASALDDHASSGSFSPGTVAYTTTLPVVTATTVVGAAEFKGASAAQFITASPSRPFSPDPESSQQQRLPSVLEAAIKAEPKVEVERLPSPSNTLDDGTPPTRLYLNTSRQNLETIVEAIRHLEGDHLFGDEPAQDVPLALTNKPSGSIVVKKQRGTIHAEVNDFLQFHNTTTSSTSPQQQQQQPTTSSLTNSNSVTTAGATVSAQATQQTQQRPGVIVVKHS